MHVVVLGAGLAGLAAAHELLGLGHRVTVLEAEGRVGGMAASWRRGRYWLDYGPHRFHTSDPELERHLYEILDGEVVRRERISRIFLRGRYFHYPLQLGDVITGLDRRILLGAVRDYLLVRLGSAFRRVPDVSFEQWVKKRFGRTLYELFFEAYTSKAWGMPCDRISADWAEQRIGQAGLWDTVRKTLWPPRNGEVRSLVQEFLYPRRGGTGEIARKYHEKIAARGGHVHLAAPLRCVEFDGRRPRRVHYEFLGNNESVEADWVINTIPLPALVSSLLPPADESLLEAARCLEHVGIVFVYLEVMRPTVSPDHWIYLPEKELRVHRISEFKNFSDTSAPGENTALCCEITCREGDATWRMSLEQAARVAVADLERCGLVSAEETRPLDLARLPHAYPVYDLEYRERLELLRRGIENLECFTTTGRQGLFCYNNMDHSIEMGRAAARRVGFAESRLDIAAVGEELVR